MSSLDLERQIPRGATVYAMGFFLTDEEIMALALYHSVQANELEAGGPHFALDQMFRRKGRNLKTLWTSRYRYRDELHPGKTKGYNFLVVNVRVGWDDEPVPTLEKSRVTGKMMDSIFPKDFREMQGEGPGMGFSFEGILGKLACLPWPEDNQCMPNYAFTELHKAVKKKKARSNQPAIVQRTEASGAADPTRNA